MLQALQRWAVQSNWFTSRALSGTYVAEGDPVSLLQRLAHAIGGAHYIDVRLAPRRLLVSLRHGTLKLFHRAAAHQTDRAAADPAARQARAVHPLDPARYLHQQIQLRATHLVILFQAAM